MLKFETRSLSVVCLCVAVSVSQGEDAKFSRDCDIVYHKGGGIALTMDKIAPSETCNHAAVVIVVSEGWVSDHRALAPQEKTKLPNTYWKSNARELLKRGYTVFYVVHGSQPKFTIREIHDQISAAVRYIRFHAMEYHISPNRIGIMGGSAGGHLSLMQGTHGLDGKEDAAEPSDESSRVQAVVAYSGPTDFENYGAPGIPFDEVIRNVMPDGTNGFLQAFDYFDFDAKKRRLSKVTDPMRLAEHYRFIAPRYNVTADDAPTLLLHGDADKAVPIQQSELMVKEFQEKKVPHRLYVRKGGGHGWPFTDERAKIVADWFDQYLTEEER